MRVAHMIDRLHLHGGAERLLHTLAEALDPKRVALTVITLREDQPEAVDALRARGARVASFPSRTFADLGRARAVLRFARAERFDVLHAHLVRSTILAGAVGRLSGTPVVATLHNTDRSDRVGRGLQLAERWVLRAVAARVVAVGWETARVHGETLRARIDVIPNAVGTLPPLAPGERPRVREELGVPPEAPLLLAVGRLVPQKAFSDLLAAFALLSRADPAPWLVIAGTGREHASLEREVARCQVGARVRLLGLRRDVPRLLGASDLYVSSSHWEGLPVAMLEAMAAGLPVVATDVGDVGRVLDEGTGVLVPPARPDALAGALASLLDDPERARRLGAAGRERVEREFSAAAWAERHLSLYTEVRRRAPPAMPGAGESRCAS